MDQKLTFMQYGEARTLHGQRIEFTCPSGSSEEVAHFIGTHVFSMNEMFTHTVPHGAFASYTRYDIVQHDYAACDGDEGSVYVELLEIRNPPDDRKGIVIHQYRTSGERAFAEWETLADAKAVFANSRQRGRLMDGPDPVPDLKGLIRRVSCPYLVPWFYAVGNQALIGDFAFPERFAIDPVFQIGTRWRVHNGTFWVVRVCLGVSIHTPYHDSDRIVRMVHWNNGSVWIEGQGEHRPRPDTQ